MEYSFAVPAVIFLLSVGARDVYELLKEGHKIDLENKAIFCAIFSIMCTLWASWFTLCLADPLPASLPDAVRWSALALVVGGFILAVGALLQLRGLENIGHLVTGGLFRKFRHPMYMRFICWIVGWSLSHGAFVSLAVGVPGIASVLWWRRLEDARLVVQFGGVYQEYRRTTWF